MEPTKNTAGRLTEAIMARVKGRLPEISTHEYNRTYEAVLETLKSADGIVKRGSGFPNRKK